MERQKLLEWEKIEKVMKWHQVYFYKLMMQFVLLLAIFWASYMYFQQSKYVIFVWIIALQFFLVYVYKKCMNYEFSKIIVTNQRILWFFKISFFEYEFFATNLSEIAHIQWKTSGFFSNHFWYGNLEIKIKWQDTSFFVYQAKDIIKNAKIIQETLLAYKKVK